MTATIEAAALAYHARGWKPVPVNRSTKKAIGKGWQNQPFSPAQFDGNAQNVAVQLGAVSGGLCDVDLDCMAAIGLAPEFLPPTAAIFGHRSKPCSHQLYRSDLHTSERSAAIQFKHRGAVILELRIGGNGKGATTVLPPSMHASGEMVQWASEGEPARVDGAQLKAAVTRLAIACLLRMEYPPPGSRHEAALVIGGVLARAGFSGDDIRQVMLHAANAAADDDPADRVEAAASAIVAKERPGWPRMREVWGDEVANTLGRWLKLARTADATSVDALPSGTEEGLALRYADQHADDLRHVAIWGRWLEWNGKQWQHDNTLHAFDHARHICREAATAASKSRAVALASAKTVTAVERLAKADRRLAASVEQWDQDPMLLNTPDGVIDLRTGETLAHRPDRHMTHITAVGPRRSDCPLWRAFLARVTNEDQGLQQFLQRVVGYALTGSIDEHAMFFLYGTGGNGKGVFITTIAGILADYHRSAPIDTFTAGSGDRHPTELAGLRGARLVTATETEEGRRWAEAKIKMLTGGDRVPARFMRQDFFEYTPQFKLLIAGNHKPSLRTVDEAIRRRLNLIPFTVTIPEDERDRGLGEKLKPEWPAILDWAIDGCGNWQERGLSPPAIVTAATDAYLQTQDAVGAWIEERCWQGPDLWASRTTLFNSWMKWAASNGEFVGTRARLIDALEARGFEPARRGEAGERGFRGLKPMPEYGDDQGD